MSQSTPSSAARCSVSRLELIGSRTVAERGDEQLEAWTLPVLPGFIGSAKKSASAVRESKALLDLGMTLARPSAELERRLPSLLPSHLGSFLGSH